MSDEATVQKLPEQSKKAEKVEKEKRDLEAELTDLVAKVVQNLHDSVNELNEKLAELREEHVDPEADHSPEADEARGGFIGTLETVLNAFTGANSQIYTALPDLPPPEPVNPRPPAHERKGTKQSD